jgi:hypothetical protein
MAILKPCEIDFNNPPVQTEMIISINDVLLETQGNLFGITGSERTGKSNYTGSLITGTIYDASFSIDTLRDSGFAQYCKQDRAALRYGTVGSTALQKHLRHTKARKTDLHAMPECFKVYCLTSILHKECLQAIVQSIDKFY